jgi:hypothetical protein
MSLEKTVRELCAEDVGDLSQRLEILVRQGLMPYNTLPILKRALLRLRTGIVLQGAERDVLTTFINSMLYIVLGNETIFQRAKLLAAEELDLSALETILEGVEALDEEEYEYTAVHAKHGKTVVKGTSSYDAAKKAAEKWKSKKGTSGIDVYRNDIKHVATEEKLAKKDHDGDGKIESGKDEYMGSRDKAIKKAMANEARYSPVLPTKTPTTSSIDKYHTNVRDLVNRKKKEVNPSPAVSNRIKLTKGWGDGGASMKSSYGKVMSTRKEEAMASIEAVKKLNESYKQTFDLALTQFGVKSPSELDEEKRKEFFNFVDKNYKKGDK